MIRGCQRLEQVSLPPSFGHATTLVRAPEMVTRVGRKSHRVRHSEKFRIDIYLRNGKVPKPKHTAGQHVLQSDPSRGSVVQDRPVGNINEVERKPLRVCSAQPIHDNRR